MNLKALTKAEIRGIKNPKKLYVAFISGIIAFYIFNVILIQINVPNSTWLKVGLSGIISFIVAEVID